MSCCLLLATGVCVEIVWSKTAQTNTGTLVFGRNTHLPNIITMMHEVDEGALTTALTASWENTSTNTPMPELKTLKRLVNRSRRTLVRGFRTCCVAATIVLAANCVIGVVPRDGRKTTTSTHRNGFSAMFEHRHLRYPSDLIPDISAAAEADDGEPHL